MKYVGLSECTPDQIRQAHAITPVSALEIEWSLWERGNEARFVAPSQARHTLSSRQQPITVLAVSTDEQGQAWVVHGRLIC